MQRQYIIGIFCLLTTGLFGQSKTNMLYGEWIQFGFKPNKAAEIKILTEDCSKKKAEFKKDGTYIEEMYCLKSSGYWDFNADSTKLGIQLTEFNGQTIGKKSAPTFRTLIIKLTQDTLVYGQEAYYGNDRVYGHDDWYFVRKRK
jgi:hypothetical protein